MFSASFWVASVAAHAAVLSAMGHAPRGSGPSIARLADAVVAVDVVPPLVAESEPLTPSPVATREHSVAPATHHHSYPAPVDHDAHPHDPSLAHAPREAPSPPAAAPEAVASPTPPPRFTMAILTGGAPSTSPAAVVGASGRGSGGGAGDGAPVPESLVSSPARVLGAVTPAYPAGARAGRVEADVVLSLVVSSRGQVEDATVQKPAGYGFDDAALRAIREARFEPARRDGRPVAVRMRWTVSFRLR